MLTCMESAIERATRLAGGQSALARKLGIQPQAVQAWCARRRAPANRFPEIEAAVAGEVSVRDLYSDLSGQAA